jgi:hypothetical protein
MSTPQRITPECQPVFPCWMWDNSFTKWWRRDAFPDAAPHGVYTHWHPDSPTAPEPVKPSAYAWENWTDKGTATVSAEGSAPSSQTAEEIAREAVYNAFPELRTGLSDDMVEASRLAAAARIIAAQMVRDSGAVEALEAYRGQLVHVARNYPSTIIHANFIESLERVDAALAALNSTKEAKP